MDTSPQPPLVALWSKKRPREGLGTPGPPWPGVWWWYFLIAAWGSLGVPRVPGKPLLSPTHCLQLQSQVVLLLGDTDMRLLQLLALGLCSGQGPTQSPQLCP